MYRSSSGAMAGAKALNQIASRAATSKDGFPPEFCRDPVVETGIGKFDQSDLGARLLLVEVGDRLELGLPAAFNDNREGVVPRLRAAAAPRPAGAQHQDTNCQRRDSDTGSPHPRHARCRSRVSEA